MRHTLSPPASLAALLPPSVCPPTPFQYVPFAPSVWPAYFQGPLHVGLFRVAVPLLAFLQALLCVRAFYRLL